MLKRFICNQTKKNCARVCFGGIVGKLIPGRCPNWKPPFRNARFLSLFSASYSKNKMVFYEVDLLGSFSLFAVPDDRQSPGNWT
jgi:hypothetical protein